MPWGKWAGTKMIDVPASYLLWLHKQGTKDYKVTGYIFDNLDSLKKECEEEKNKR